MSSDEKHPGSCTTVGNVLLIAFWAVSLVQLLHEATHVAFGLALGAHIKLFNFWAIDLDWPVPTGFWPEAIVTGSAALVNILCAGICIRCFPHIRRHPLRRLFVFFFGAYSLFIGFGYLLIDALRASPESIGDWAKIIMLLGGSWIVRLPIFVIGCAGTIYGYFWMGWAALHFPRGDMHEKRKRMRVGLTLCILPYIILNALFSVLAFWHPLGITGALLVLTQLWLGYIGFFWAFMIKFIWSKYDGPFENETTLPHKVTPQLVVSAAVLLLVVVILSRGLIFTT